MITVQELKLQPVWVNPQHLAATAGHIMAGHKLKAIGVLEGKTLVGALALEDVLRAPEGALVASVMREPGDTVDARSPIREVAERFVDRGIDFACVMDGERYVGIVSPADLLRELGKSYDPLTGLSWSDRLREWGVENLKAGAEITILFIDLNDFGQYNKRYGHIVGDRVLQRVCEYIAERIDPQRDLLVRYGGDEFAIGTLLWRDDAEELAAKLREDMDQVMVGEVAEPVTFSIGIFGGRRTKERENVHYAATLDNLINIASKNALEEKRRLKEQREAEERERLQREQELREAEAAARPPEPAVVDEPAPATPGAALRVIGVYAGDLTPSGVTTVILSSHGKIYSGADPRQDKSPVESVAVATMRALERQTMGRGVRLESVELIEDESREKLIRVETRSGSNGSGNPGAAARPVAGDLYAATAEATIAAVMAAQGS
jgi:IMP dehydrogenase